ncbi:MAG: DNA primase, partial [Lachnospiraceae bacterium]|nr:DNA primase [Lachnospiraceae bacterium]
AELFSTKLNVPMDEQGRKKEFADTVIRVKQNSLDAADARALEQNDFGALQRNMEKRKELGKLHSSLNLG